MEFDPAAVPTESTMVRYFEEGLKPSIKAEMDQDATHLDDYEELVAKAVRAEAKAGLRPSSYVREADIQVLRGNRPAHTTAHKVQTQGAVSREERGKGPASTPASASTDPEPSDKLERTKKRSSIETRGIPENPETPQPPESTWLGRREQKKEKEEGPKRGYVL